MAKKLTKQSEDFSAWYNDVVQEAELAEHSGVKGCMVIRPYGYAIWEKMQRELDRRFKETGHKNAYFPLLIPKSFIPKEAEHVEGFAKECAVVTHHRLRAAAGGGVEPDPESLLEEPLRHPPDVRDDHLAHVLALDPDSSRPAAAHQPVGERRALGDADAPVPAHGRVPLAGGPHGARHGRGGAGGDAAAMLDVYRDFAEEFMAVPVLPGLKTESQKFAGAVETFCIEAMMQDGKALQAGTSHFLGQNFAQAFDVTFQNEKGERELAWATTWGVSTRLVGALVMTHGDDRASCCRRGSRRCSS